MSSICRSSSIEPWSSNSCGNLSCTGLDSRVLNLRGARLTFGFSVCQKTASLSVRLFVNLILFVPRPLGPKASPGARVKLNYIALQLGLLLGLCQLLISPLLSAAVRFHLLQQLPLTVLALQGLRLLVSIA